MRIIERSAIDYLDDRLPGGLWIEVMLTFIDPFCFL